MYVWSSSLCLPILRPAADVLITLPGAALTWHLFSTFWNIQPLAPSYNFLPDMHLYSWQMLLPLNNRPIGVTLPGPQRNMVQCAPHESGLSWGKPISLLWYPPPTPHAILDNQYLLSFIFLLLEANKQNINSKEKLGLLKEQTLLKSFLKHY